METKTGFKNEVLSTPGGANALNCFLCGSCTAGCPVNEIDDGYNPRKIMRLILLDQKDELLSSKEIWKCNQCHACVSHCPQDVRFADVLRALRELSVEQGFFDAGLPGRVEELDLEARKLRLDKINELLG
ncbi:MAG: 4Fe-4S dicluster domain-containing protein [Clostridiales bacterium]|nr:4Fe-4S dicluster domain-containing protein [Clostridiales bacterium]